MGREASDGSARYVAFISYSHADAAFGRRLHRQLEGFVVPRRMVGRVTAGGKVPRRLSPVFRDREELCAATDLSREVRAALAASGALIVVCSPAAAASPWVQLEIELFRQLHPDRPILAALAAGEPRTAFPPNLALTDPDGAMHEPLAADFRPGADGRRLALLKLVAAIVDVRLDELAQRDAQRRLRRVTAVTVAALVLALGMGLLALVALNARREAERQRREAEGMVEFMLTDLRDRLKGVGRLDIMTAANQRAFHYYAGQDLQRLSPDSLERRARVLHAIGEDDQTRGDLNGAALRFDEAARTTARLLAKAPGDLRRVYADAQSQFYLGSIRYSRGRYREAKVSFREYKRLADILVSRKPADDTYRTEAAFAEGNLCSVALQPPVDAAEALRSCAAALALMRQATLITLRTPATQAALANREAWFADALEQNGRPTEALAFRLTEDHRVDALLSSDPANMDYADTWVATQIALIRLETKTGQLASAKARLRRAQQRAQGMTSFDASNARWRRQLSLLQPLS